MTPQEHATYLKLAFQSVGYSFNDEQIETIILTTKSVDKKKGKFTLMDSAKIQADINAKYHSEPGLFDELEQIEKEREL